MRQGFAGQGGYCGSIGLVGSKASGTVPKLVPASGTPGQTAQISGTITVS